jgi:hypothetical protein
VKLKESLLSACILRFTAFQPRRGLEGTPRGRNSPTPSLLQAASTRTGLYHACYADAHRFETCSVALSIILLLPRIVSQPFLASPPSTDINSRCISIYYSRARLRLGEKRHIAAAGAFDLAPLVRPLRAASTRPSRR